MQIESVRQGHDTIARRLTVGTSSKEAPGELLDRIHEREKSWRNLLDAMERERKLDAIEWNVLLTSWSVWQRSVEHIVHALAWIAGRHDASDRIEKLGEAAEVFRKYAHDVAERVAGSHDDVARSAGAGALAIASRQLARSSALAAEAIDPHAITGGEERERSGPSLAQSSPQSVVFYAQERELASRGKPLTTHNPDAIRQFSPAAEREERAHHIGQLICQCNRAAKFARRPEIFRPTTTLVQSISSLPFIVVVDRVSLGTFNDCLYFALYEDAGGGTLRYLEENGGPFRREDPVCNVIWAIKALRNKLLRHDPDCGGEGEVAKSWSGFNECLADIGIRSWPVGEGDFAHLQDLLIDKATMFLQELLTRMNASDE